MEHEEVASRLPEFGTLLRQHRLGAGLSQGALAERARMSTEGISALERGYRRNPQRETLALLAGALALNAEQRSAFEKAAARSGAPRGASVTVGPWNAGEFSNLPLALSTFIGRGRELDEIAALVQRHRLVTVTGAGGVGKTQTALQVARTRRDDASAWFVTLASVSKPDLVPQAIASSVGAQQIPSRCVLDTLIAFLKNKVSLLLLDDCDHVIGMAASVAEKLLIGCPDLRVLATSREPLLAAGERRYQLASLRDDDAVALFVDRARAVETHFTLSQENAPLVGEICRKLDGIPLAIELAAARVNLLSLAALNGRLEDRLGVLTGGRRTVPQQRTMRATIDWSYDLLSASEQRVFERLSVFVGGCTLAAASAVCAGSEISEPDVLDVLASLVDKSLVTVDLERSQPRYGLLESFRQYARERLGARGEGQATAHRHAMAYSDLTLRDTRGEAWPLEDDNFRAALQWSLVERGDLPCGWQIASVIGACESVTPAERQTWTEFALDLVDETTPVPLLAKLHTAKAMVAYAYGKYEASIAGSTAALACFRTLGDSRGLARAKSHIGHALHNLGRTADAQVAFGEALALLRRLNDTNSSLLAGVLMGLGLVVSADIAVVRSYFAEARQIYEAHKNAIGVAYSLMNLSEREFVAGNVETALRSATDALEFAKTLPGFAITKVELTALNGIAVYLIALERYDEAASRAREMLALAREHAADYQIALAAGHLAVITAVRAQTATERSPVEFVAAARMLGFADGRLARIGSLRDGVAQPQYERIVNILGAALGSEALAQLLAEGAALPEEAAIGPALRL
jgi:predicted ATPase/DNA-binding XRE family transcriptional regulator